MIKPGDNSSLNEKFIKYYNSNNKFNFNYLFCRDLNLKFACQKIKIEMLINDIIIVNCIYIFHILQHNKKS